MEKNTKPVQSAERKDGGLSALTGLAVHVSAADGTYLFTAAFQPVTGDTAYLYWRSGTAPDDLRARMPDTYPVTVRSYNQETDRALRASGLVRQTGERTWAMARIVLSEGGSERRDFRQPITFAGTVVFPDREGGAGTAGTDGSASVFLARQGTAFSFRTADLSVRGIGLLLDRPASRGERLRLASPFLERLGVPALLCRVRYAARTAAGDYLCGCEFEELDGETERILSNLILRLQTRGDTFIA